MTARYLLAIALTATGFAAASWSAIAQNAVLPGQSVAETRQAMEAAEAQAKAALERAEALQDRADKAVRKADRAKADIQVMAARVQESEARIAAAEARIAIIDRLKQAQERRLARRQEPVIRLTAALQQLSRRPTALALVKPGSLEETVRVRALMASIRPQVDALSQELRDDIARSRLLREQAEEAAALLRDARQRLEDRRLALARLETRARLESRELTGGAQLEEDRAIALAENARDLDELIDRITVSGSLREQLAALDGPRLRPDRPELSTVVTGANRAARRSTRPAYVVPVIGALITGFGEVSDSGVTARGITIRAGDAAQIVAPASSRVAYAGNYRGFGKIIILEHDGGWTTLITGLGKVDAAVGDDIAQGTPIGRAPAGEGGDIIIELRRNGQPVDVATLIAAQ
ncbi:MAG: peptidoglycan DD-metalloendopeptidase family protein [Pseudomonadota bacterium]